METETTVILLDKFSEKLWKRLNKLSYDLDVLKNHDKSNKKAEIAVIEREIARLTEMRIRIAHRIWYQTNTPKPRKSKSK